ncbi:hypothetical protein [uncultured Paraglaciecola sp.]|uniref:hypothetical protein n=1 Tax=uncultured Paraglaciecola sp. TaxID=1765024 RepID=UPI0025976EC8|nr:hypothetical protein [uncultured Paraglaciecola sp.]
MKSLVVLLVSLFTVVTANATLIDFEDVTTSGGRVDLAVSTPYSEEGYVLTSTHKHAALLDSAYIGSGFDFIGNDTDWFGFSEYNTVTLTAASGSTFDFSDLVLGLNAYASNSSIDVLITGNLLSGGSLVSSLTNISTATFVDLGWTGLTEVVFTTSDDVGLDNLNVFATSSAEVSAPGAFAIIALGLVMIGFRKTRNS